MHSVFASDVKIGQLYDLSSEYGECIIFDDSFTLLGNTYQSELMKDTLLPSLKTDDSSYFLLSCTVDDIDFLTILTDKGNKHVFHNWEIPFSKSHNKNVKTVPILEGVYVNSVSGYISEKSRNGSTVEYLPEKMSLGLNPWAIKADETVKKIVVSCWPGTFPVEGLIVANGFISIEKPYLYKENSRLKRLKVTINGKSGEYDLCDTPDFQVLPLPIPLEPRRTNTIEIEILDWYPGEKYSDIVLSGLYFVDANIK